MMAFHDAHKGVMDINIVRRERILEMILGCSPDSVVTVRSIAHWLATSAARAKRERFLCMDCDTTFHDRRMPEAFMVVTPFAAEIGPSIVTGICRRCADRDDAELLQAAFNAMRKLYPQATKVEAGRPV
jgi:hypothetical protein